MDYILQRPSGYYFRFQFPTDVKPLVNKSELRYSLQTRSIDLAKSKARLIAGKIQSIIRSIRKGFMTGLTIEQVNRLITKHIRESLEADEYKRIVDDTPFDNEYHKNHLKILDKAKGVLQERLATKDNKYITESVDNLLKSKSIDADKKSFAYRMLCRDMFKAEAHIFEVMRKRQMGDYSGEIIPEFLKEVKSYAPALPQESDKVSKTITQVMSDFFEEGDAEDRWTPKTKTEVKASMQVLVDYFGDIPIDTIDRKKMGQYKRDIMKLPPNMNKDKRYRDLTIKKILELKPSKTIAVHTINKYLSRAKTLFDHARINGEIPLNPAEGMTIKKTKRSDEEREVFTPNELKIIFGSKQYTNNTFTKSYMYWSPILAAFTGARLEEICSLHLDDFEKHEGVWCININDNGDKQLKNAASRRIIPLHPFLVDLGIIRLVDHLKGQNKPRFFYDLPKMGVRYGTYVGRWFNERYKKSVGINVKVFHSFRHTFGTNLSHNGINDHSLKALMGHSEDSITFGTYVKRGTPKKLFKDLAENLDYDLNLNHLKNSIWTIPH